MESTSPFLWVIGAFIALDSYAKAMAARRRAGIDSPDRSADLRARAWSEIAGAMRRWMLVSLFAPIGWMFLTRPFLTPGSDLGKGVAALGGGLLLFGAVLALQGASRLLTGLGHLRDAKRAAAEDRP
jgi:hypothetical protein